MDTKTASARDTISLTFLLSAVESPKARVITAGQGWAALEPRAKVKATAAAWSPAPRPLPTSSQSPQPCYPEAVDLRWPGQRRHRAI